MRTMAGGNFLRAFDAVYLLNLPERTDRLRESFAVLEEVDAEARTLVEVVPGVRATEAHGFPSVGAYGCFKAHLQALRLAMERGVGSVLVLEDDFYVEREMEGAWPTVEAVLAGEPWDLVNVGFHDSFDLTQEDERGLVFRTNEALGLAHCYAVSGAALPALVAYLELVLVRPEGHPQGGAMHFDGALHHFFVEHPGAVRLRLRRSLVGQRSSRSDIAGARWFDRDLAGAGWAVAGLRRLRNRFR